ncbi:phage head spike fiber domain-containing protein [Celeribacter indicus]|uniref:Uncharacterized protein n=1 Tax=Celeribacter indicus TaxID=1208324 RepID=A0A0B5DSH7_9RHOB|nr:hypothetical protein [Celeribacter indicus]AJE46004.1 hypothetical protein P73_1289 [Celeribacter indicus]SDX32654.1 hypothetical protein SAMN05443573_1224 [Celeribacter indicus]
MAITKTTVVGPAVLPNDTRPKNGNIIFTLSAWDIEDGQAVVIPGSIVVPLLSNGDFSVGLFSTTAGTRGVVYSVAVEHEPFTGRKVRTDLGQIALSGPGPVRLEALLQQPAAPPTAPDVLAQVLAARAAAEAAAALTVDAGQDADRAEDAAAVSEGAAATAQIAAASTGAFAEATLAAAISAGLAATAQGQAFHAAGADVDYIGLYRHDAGSVASELARYPTAPAVSAAQVQADGAFALARTLAVRPALEGAEILADFGRGAYAVGDRAGLKRAVRFGDLFQFSRASTATYYDAEGVLRTAAVGVPRFDHDPVTGAARGVLIEPSATNFEVNSGRIAERWTVSSGIQLAYGADAPMAGEKWTVVTTDGTFAQRTFGNAMSVAPGATATGSIFIDAGQSDDMDGEFTFYVGLSSSYRAQAHIKIEGDVVSVSSAPTDIYEQLSTGVERVGRGVYRVWITVRNVSSAASPTVVGLWERVAEGAGVKSIAVWGAQIEAGRLATSYIPTTGAPVTRAADDLIIRASAFPFGIMPEAVSLYLRGDMSYADTDSLYEMTMFRWETSATNSLLHRLSTLGSATGQLGVRQISNGGAAPVVASVPDLYGPGRGRRFAMASRHGRSLINGAVNGTVLTEANESDLPNLIGGALRFSTSGVLRIAQFALWPRDIGDTMLGEITA